MTDLHTHILPGMDDGAPDVETALKMLEAQAKQGVKTVALTPHFYRNKEHISDFLERRETAWINLQNNIKSKELPRVILAAEVAYVPGMFEWQELDRLCYQGTKLLLVEPPMTPWNGEMLRQLYALESRCGITPMIAHFDRYLGIQSNSYINQMIETGFPLQISAFALQNFFVRGKAMKLLTDYNAVLVSDCHNITTRPPNMGAASGILMKKLGSKAEKVLQYAGEIICGL